MGYWFYVADIDIIKSKLIMKFRFWEEKKMAELETIHSISCLQSK